jgi:hypothetical protein
MNTKGYRCDRPGLTAAGRANARTAVRSTVPQQGCAAGCVRLGVLRAVGRLHRAARVLADERTWPCTARAGLAYTCRGLASMRTQSVHAGRIGGGLQRNRAPLDAEDGVPVSAVTAADGTPSSAFLVPTAPRTAWQLANSVSQLFAPDASWGVIWAQQTTPNVASTTKIEAEPLQRAGYVSEPATVNPLICDEGQVRCDRKGGGSKAMAACDADGASRQRAEASVREWMHWEIGRRGARGGRRNGGSPETHLKVTGVSPKPVFPLPLLQS